MAFLNKGLEIVVRDERPEADGRRRRDAEHDDVPRGRGGPDETPREGGV